MQISLIVLNSTCSKTKRKDVVPPDILASPEHMQDSSDEHATTRVGAERSPANVEPPTDVLNCSQDSFAGLSQTVVVPESEQNLSTGSSGSRESGKGEQFEGEYLNFLQTRNISSTAEGSLGTTVPATGTEDDKENEPEQVCCMYLRL